MLTSSREKDESPIPSSGGRATLRDVRTRPSWQVWVAGILALAFVVNTVLGFAAGAAGRGRVSLGLALVLAVLAVRQYKRERTAQY